jgi:exopolysaccharide biosynthesis protein
MGNLTTSKRLATKKSENADSSNQRRKGNLIRKSFLAFSGTIMSFFLIGLFLLYGPISYFRVTLVTTAMQTFQHQWLATMFYDQTTINDILSHNAVIIPKPNSNPGSISVDSSVKDNATTLPVTPADGERIIDGVGFTVLSGRTYNGWLVKIYDPSRLYMGLSQNFGKSGERVSHMATRLGAYVGINAGGFIDVGGEGNGGTPDALFIANGKIMTPSKKPAPHSIIGFNSQNKLILSTLNSLTGNSLSGLGLKSAVEFKPFFIVDGVPSKILGNGGGGMPQPRTAVGQTKSGTILFVVINGRSLSSEGATYQDLQNIMLQNGAYNAANLDGGASSVVVVDGKVINHPSSQSGERYLPNAFLLNHTSSWAASNPGKKVS